MAPQHSDFEKLWRHKIPTWKVVAPQNPNNLKHITQDPMIQGGMLPVLTFWRPDVFFLVFWFWRQQQISWQDRLPLSLFNLLWTKKSVELMWNNVVLMRKWSQLTLLRLLHTKKDPAAEHWWGPNNSCLLDIARLTLNRLICLLMKKSANWTMCEYNVCITNASVAINYRAFDLVYTVNLALSQNILRHLATELLYPPPDQRASIYHARPAGSRGSAVGRIYNTMHASWSSPACLWKTKQTGLNSKFPVGASSKSCFLEHISCGIQCMRERIKNIQTFHPQKTPQWRKQKGQCNLYVCALCPSMSILPLCISHPSIWPSMRTQHEAAPCRLDAALNKWKLAHTPFCDVFLTVHAHAIKASAIKHAQSCPVNPFEDPPQHAVGVWSCRGAECQGNRESNVYSKCARNRTVDFIFHISLQKMNIWKPLNVYRHPVVGIEDGRFLMWIFMCHELLYSCHTCNRNDSSQETHVLGIAESCWKQVDNPCFSFDP